MAVSFDKLKKDFDTAELSIDELRCLEKNEKHIDDALKANFNPSERINVPLGYVAFNNFPKLPIYRREILKRELTKRYREAGWNIVDNFRFEKL